MVTEELQRRYLASRRGDVGVVGFGDSGAEGGPDGEGEQAMIRPNPALAVCFAGIALMILGSYLLTGPWALVAGGALVTLIGVFVMDASPARRGSRG